MSWHVTFRAKQNDAKGSLIEMILGFDLDFYKVLKTGRTSMGAGAQGFPSCEIFRSVQWETQAIQHNHWMMLHLCHPGPLPWGSLFDNFLMVYNVFTSTKCYASTPITSIPNYHQTKHHSFRLKTQSMLHASTHQRPQWYWHSIYTHSIL